MLKAANDNVLSEEYKAFVQWNNEVKFVKPWEIRRYKTMTNRFVANIFWFYRFEYDFRQAEVLKLRKEIKVIK